ncbi:DNA-processing protein DprA [Secundilactobacillus kimchicus]|uniref:DNA-processing protein DprA n=1 Tax=Secundilactobacillus kimchicus TaxID=528209 RepID=UPI0024A8DB28|nr:DNA-processing protein DprA [Secundilactobacillus kimchicus]
MDVRIFLKRLKLATGIGIKGETLVYEWIQAHPGEFKHLSADRIASIAQLGKTRTAFCQDFISDDLNQRIERHADLGWLSIVDPEYPEMLKESFQPPIGLFYRGNIALLTATHLSAVIGTRTPTAYAYDCLEALLPEVVADQVVVVSGLARGIDSMSHRLTLNLGGHSIGVIGTGLDVTYPRENARLQDYMATHELVLSEYSRDAYGQKFHFVERNRIIAGLVETLLVVEAKKKSGTLITASLALQNNRNVLAVPGKITDLFSQGCNELIRAGAQPTLTAADIMAEFRGDLN